MAIIPPIRVAENIGHFTGRTWLLPKILEWWNRTDEQLFLLTGSPGTGKSMLSAWLAFSETLPQDPTALAQLTYIRSLVKAAHFCQASSRSPKAFAQNVAIQLRNNVKGFADALDATLPERVYITATATQKIETVGMGGTVTGILIDLGSLSEELSFDRAFTQPLKKLYDRGYSEPILLVVDALDEALGYTGDKTLPALLATLDEFPAGVRVLATTRDDPRVMKLFRDTKPFDLIKDAPPDVDDVRVYALQRLNSWSAVPAAKADEFAQRLSTQARGVFLYAAMVLDDLLARAITDLPDLDTFPLPAGLSELYLHFLNRELGKNEQVWFDLYEPVLGLIAVAQGEGLTSVQLTAIIGKDIRAALRDSKQYLDGELPDGPFRLFHKSFADFLLEDKDNVDYHIDAKRWHLKIGDYYWSQRRDWSQCDAYGLGALAIHLFDAQDFPRLAQLISPDWMRVRISGYRFAG